MDYRQIKDFSTVSDSKVILLREFGYLGEPLRKHEVASCVNVDFRKNGDIRQNPWLFQETHFQTRHGPHRLVFGVVKKRGTDVDAFMEFHEGRLEKLAEMLEVPVKVGFARGNIKAILKTPHEFTAYPFIGAKVVGKSIEDFQRAYDVAYQLD